MSQALPSSAGFPMRQPVDLRHLHDPTYQTYQILHVAFVVAPIIAGLDKFFHLLVNWDNYLAPVINSSILGGHGHEFMLAAGVIEIVAGVGVALWPRIFSYVVAAWLPRHHHQSAADPRVEFDAALRCRAARSGPVPSGAGARPTQRRCGA